MEDYDPEVAPISEDWLEIDEGVRLLLVEAYHRDARISLPKRARTLHASMHVVAENQLASNDEVVVRAFTRLMSEGLSRHDAIHAIGSVVLKEILEALKPNYPGNSIRPRYYAAVEQLTAATWLASGEAKTGI